MGSDAKRSLAAAEKLLKQDKVNEALSKFNRAIEQSNGDLLTVNRVGDALAGAGQGEKAVPYYSRIADQFTRQGFFPKAVAIRKKILRLTPDSLETLVGLGDLYVRQEHPGEARAYYLKAAEQLLQVKDYEAAREVYERLVQAEPDDARHRVRLAETRAIAGDASGAAGDLIELGRRLLGAGQAEDAEKALNRAEELDPGRPEVLKARIECLTAAGRVDEALEMLEAEAAKPDAAIEWFAELVELYETSGRTQKADGLLSGERASDFADRTFQAIIQFHEREGSMPALWSRLEPVLDTWLADDRKDRAVALLDAVPAWLDLAFEPALERRLAYAEQVGDEPTQTVLLERLVGAYREAGRAPEAEVAADKLAALRPSAPAGSEDAGAGGQETTTEIDQVAVAGSGADVPVEYEAPAVPLSRADEEFVSGRLTQAEILEKYGLLTQAVDQLYEVVERFPGHLESNQRLVTLLRGTSEEANLAQALIKLSLARRAAGRIDVARQSVAEADKLGGIDDNMRRILSELDLLPGSAPTFAAPPATPEPVAATPEPAVVTPEPVAVTPEPVAVQPQSVTPTAPAAVTPEPVAVQPQSVTPTAPAATAAAPELMPAARDSETVIDFDTFDDEDDDTAGLADEIPDLQSPAAAVAAEAPVIESFSAADLLPDLELPDAGLESPLPSTDEAMRFEPLPALADDQDDADLAAIAAALDEELFEDDVTDVKPMSESEESIDEVFAAFRERVDEEIGADDFRTHYDLGIGYKEMGLIDAAVAEFEISIKSEELFQQSCVMLAMCCREQAQLDRAVEWYRQAVRSLHGHGDSDCGLRYDLAEMLLEIGDSESALDLFRDVAEHAPGFRDVSQRVAELAPAGSD